MAQPNRWIWVFHIESDGKSFLATEYQTSDEKLAIETAKREYGYTVIGATRRELTFEEYCIVLHCVGHSGWELRVYQAMLQIVYTGQFECDGQVI